MPIQAHAHGRASRLPRFFSSLRFRLMLWYLLILGIVLCVFSTAIYVLEDHTLYLSLNTLLTTAMGQLAPSYDSQSGQVVETNASVLVILQNPQGRFTQVSPTVSPSALPALRFSLPLPAARHCFLRALGKRFSLKGDSVETPAPSMR